MKTDKIQTKPEIEVEVGGAGFIPQPGGTPPPPRDIRREFKEFLKERTGPVRMDQLVEELTPETYNEMFQAFEFLDRFEGMSRLEQASQKEAKELAEKILDEGTEAAKKAAEEIRKHKDEDRQRFFGAIDNGKEIYESRLRPALEQVLDIANEIESGYPGTLRRVAGDDISDLVIVLKRGL